MPVLAVATTRRRRFLPWALVCALLIAYSSTVVGPTGLNFVPLDPAGAWREFLARALTWVSLGSDQRADWVGNLLLYVPFGFLLAGVTAPGPDADRSRLAAIGAACVAFMLALAFVLAVKFAQLFFPPRTVMLNYVVAQGVGAAIGILAFALARARTGRPLWRGLGSPRENLRLALGLYAAAMVVFVLMPLDFALGTEDLRVQLARLPDIVSAVPGAGRPLPVRAALLVAGAVAMAPLGVLLVLGPGGRNRSTAVATAWGFGAMLLLLALAALLVSGTPALVSVPIRTAGIAAGAWSLRWFQRQDIDRLLFTLRRLSVWAIAPYLLLLLAVNGLLSTQWQTPAEAAEAIYLLGLLPLFDYYIVSKAAAAANIVAHAVMYAPIGVFVWLNGARQATAAVAALLLALAVEAGRYLRPGLEGDVNAVAVAALAAWLTARAMPAFWRLIKDVARAHGSMPGATRARPAPQNGRKADDVAPA